MNKYLCPLWKMTFAAPSVLTEGPVHHRSLDSYFGGNEILVLCCSLVLIHSISDVWEANVQPLLFYLLQH